MHSVEFVNQNTDFISGQIIFPTKRDVEKFYKTKMKAMLFCWVSIRKGI